MKKFTGIFIFTLILCISCTSTPKKTKKQKNSPSMAESPIVSLENSVEDDSLLNPENIEPPVPQPKYTLKTPEGNPVRFSESWSYVMKNREDEYDKSIPVTDVCYFSAEINSYGELVGVPKRSNLDVGNARCHLVIICDSRSLSHFIINPKYDCRKKLLNDIVKAAAPYDGVQLDLELIPSRDRKHYLTFIADLRYKLKGKMLSVAVPARVKRLSEDVYPYSDIALYCDRVFVMAYDEHWSTSKPGPVASEDWCRKVMEYAVKEIPAKKLIMGIPFYGRSWADETTAGAWYFSGANRIMTEHNVEEISYENNIPKFQFKTEVNVTGYFNDAYSCVNLCRMYKEGGVKKIGFWRIGQEDPDFWKWIIIE